MSIGRKEPLKLLKKQVDDIVATETVDQLDTLPVSLPNLQQIYIDASTPSLLQLKHHVQKTAVLLKGT